MRVGVIGINYKLANLELREVLAKTCQKRLNPQNSMHGDQSFVLLSTCNRTEIYFSSEDLATSHSYLLSILRQDVDEDFDQKLYSYFGHDCLLHLCRVTAGLDSAVVAETEIQGQVKLAYEQAQEFHALSFEMHFLFQKSLAIAKKARGALPTKPGLPGIEHAIFQTGQDYFHALLNTRVLFIGASEINKKILSFFTTKRFKNLTLCNQSDEKGRLAASGFGINFLSWNELKNWPFYDWIIFGTKSPKFLIHQSDIQEKPFQDKLITDLGVPRNVDPEIAKHPNISLLNIDQLNQRLEMRRKRLEESLYQAEQFLAHSTHQQMKLFYQREKNLLQRCAISA